MSATSDYELSREYSFYHKGALLDLFVGSGILLAGATLWAKMAWLAGVWIAVFLPFWIAGRKAITYRRAHDVEAPAGESPRIGFASAGMIGLLVLGGLATVVFMLGFENLPIFRSLLDTYIQLIAGTGIALLLTFCAIVMRLPRFYAYAVLALAFFAFGHPFAWPIWSGMMLVGGLISLAGTLVLIRFLQTHPIPN